jgi:hypothetical protein
MIMIAGIVLVVVGVLWSVFKGYVVWDAAHEVEQGASAPTIDFPIICPIPLAVGTSLLLRARHSLPFPGFGFAFYALLAGLFGSLLWFFDRLGERERQRQLERMRKNGAIADNPNA